MKNSFKLVSLGVMIALSACQTMPNRAITQELAQTPAKHSAKTQLKKAIEKTAKTSFFYHSDITLGNALREQALHNATAEQLGNSDDELFRCENEHDNRYVALGKQALEQGLDISSDNFLEDKQKIKEDFLVCKEMYGETYEQLMSALTGESESAETEDDTEATADSDDVAKIVAGGDDDSISKYDTDHTAKDVKKADVLREYFLEPTKLSISGNYRPLIGSLSILPVVDYEFYNAKLMINQPIYIDLKAGEIYVWADNLAAANAVYLDKKLGLQWQNKWLKLQLNDGSLPQTFKEDFVKSYLAAQKESFDALADGDFAYINKNELPATIKNRKEVQKSVAVIGYLKDGQNPSYKVAASFHQKMLEKYPMLGEKSQASQVDSLRLMRAFFAYLDKKATKAVDDAHTPKPAVGRLMGLSAKGEIEWVFDDRYVQSKFNPSDEPMSVSSFTVLHKEPKADFARLPKEHQKPTADNSVDFLVYIDSFKEELKTNDNLYIGLLARSIFGDEYDESLESVETDAESADAKASDDESY